MAPDSGTRLTVLYDAQCRVCTRIAARLAALDRAGRLRLRPLQRASEDDWPVVRALAERRDLRRALHVIDERGQWASGGEAMLRALERVPALRPWVRLARRPPLVGLVEPGYRWFARHRARFSWLASPGWSPRGGPGPYSAPRSASVGESRAARIAG